MRKHIHKLINRVIRPIELANLLKFIFRIRREYHFINGFYWYLDPASNFGYRLLTEGSYELEMTTKLISSLSPGDVFVDLGGNEGYFSILGSNKVGPTGSVYCIEPQQRLWPVILCNVNKNRCLNINLLPFVVSSTPQDVLLTLSPSVNTGSSSIVPNRRNRHWKKQAVGATTLDQLFFEKDIHIKLLKIDIEGYEYNALLGCKMLLRQKRIKNIVIELHPQQLSEMNQSVDQILELLSSFGYTESDGVFHPIETGDHIS